MQSSNINLSIISDIENDKDDDSFVENNQFMDHSVSLLNYKQNLNPMSSVLMSKTIYEEYFEVQPNLKKKLYD